jgi:hypothetical protein
MSSTMGLPRRPLHQQQYHNQNYQQQNLSILHNAYTPTKALEICSRIGYQKAHTRIDKTILSSILAGALLSFAGACYVIIQSSPWYLENAPG